MSLWDTATSTLQYTQAGHDPILHYQAASDDVVELAHGGMALGMMEDISKVIQTQTVQAKAGDVFVLYTDGIPEAWQGGKRKLRYGPPQRGHQTPCKAGTAQEIHDGILADVRAFMGDTPPGPTTSLYLLSKKPNKH